MQCGSVYRPRMPNDQLAWLLAAIDLEIDPDATATRGRFEERVPDSTKQRCYYRLANAIKRLCESTVEMQLNAIYQRIALIQQAMSHLLNGADDAIHTGRDRLACELIALLEKERRLVGIEPPAPAAPEVTTIITKVAVVMVNDHVKCVEPFNPEVEDAQAVVNRHRQDQVAIFKQRNPQGNPADHLSEVGFVHVHVHDLKREMRSHG